MQVATMQIDSPEAGSHCRGCMSFYGRDLANLHAQFVRVVGTKDFWSVNNPTEMDIDILQKKVALCYPSGGFCSLLGPVGKV